MQANGCCILLQLEKKATAHEQESRKLPQHKLRADMKTRWGSVFDMIDRILEQQEAIVVLASDRKAAHLVPSWQDMDVLDSVAAVLCPLRDFTDLLSGETKVPILPLLTQIQDNILSHKETDSSLTTENQDKNQS